MLRQQSRFSGIYQITLYCRQGMGDYIKTSAQADRKQQQFPTIEPFFSPFSTPAATPSGFCFSILRNVVSVVLMDNVAYRNFCGALG